MKSILILAGLVCAAVAVARADDITKGIVTLESKSGSHVSGTIIFSKAGDDVEAMGDIQGLTPGKHGLHIHEKGDCSAADAASAGGHFNPTQKHHGGPEGDARHSGDLGNIEADANGKAHLDDTIAGLTIGDGGNHDVIGHSVVIHAKEDDMKTDPSGNSGGRVAAGAIVAK